ncbi:hypothetical protein Z945_3236 [Sulfitobacter noctilucae]|uniref:hypothetical protein n=1 Tax=Sulfitobacter noctilucae TaxID=1342302 RepID=UPI000468E03C|nr:hypothetical protein [Sulfitobacter noctilucae]KIN70772.1 hypothetical protein Z945_3236 [Sulfitobacter noctilucae]
MKNLALLFVLALPQSTSAQPFSESMADCASVYQNAAQWVKTDDSADRLMSAAVSWAEAAVKQSYAEGQPTTAEAVWEKIDRKTEGWEAKGHKVFFTQDFRDWTQYCRSFAKAQGIALNP